MSSPHDPKIYARCMGEIKERVQIIDDAIAPWRTSKEISIPQCELAGLQLRKVFELIVFASLAANKEGYAKLRQKFEKDWNLAEILKILRKINPDFFPIPIEETESNLDGVRYEIKAIEGRKILVRDIVKMHGTLGELLHSRNPYRKELDYKKWLKEITRYRDRVVRLLDKHRVTVRPHKIYYRVIMRGENGHAQCAVLTATSELEND